MKIVIAPDSFKESLSAEKCCQAIKAGFSTLFPDANYICLPIADGGEGTVDAMVAATGGNIVTLEVCGPMGEKVNAFYGITGDGKTAVIEMAAASGLMLVAPEKRNPLLASSFGTGELIRHALDNGIRHMILGIGGSATVDGGMGMAQALGVRFLDADGQVLVANGGNLARVASIEMEECDPRLANCHIEVACDVDNPLVGARGAAACLARKKGQRRRWSKNLNRGCKITPVFYNSKLKLMSARWRAVALRAVWGLRRRYSSMRILNRVLRLYCGRSTWSRRCRGQHW